MMDRFIGGMAVGCLLSSLTAVSLYALGLTTLPGWLVIALFGVISGLSSAAAGAGARP